MKRSKLTILLFCILLCGVFSHTRTAAAQCVIQSPAIVSSVHTPGETREVVVAGSYAYISQNTHPRIEIIDISDPLSPTSVGHIVPLGVVRGMFIAGPHIYAVTEDFYEISRLEIFDIGNPLAPAPLGTVELPDDAMDIVASGNYAYAVHFDGLEVIDVSDPAVPQPVGSFDAIGYGVSVKVSGFYVYFLDRGCLHILDLSNPEELEEVACIDIISYSPISLSLVGDLAYVSTYHDGLEIFDISDPASPFAVGTHDEISTRADIVFSGNFGYVTRLDSDLQILDMSDPYRPHIIGTAAMPNYARSVAISGSYAYVADVAWGLQVVDVSQPFSPHKVSSMTPPSWSQGLAVSDTYAYIANGYSGLQIMDISDPYQPQPLGLIETPGVARDLAIVGSYAYVADQNAGLQIVQIADPYAPVIVGSAATTDEANDVAVAGTRAYVATKFENYKGRLEIFDTSNPFAPSLLGSVKIPGVANGVALSGSYALVADEENALQVVDTSDATSPYIVGSVDLPGDAKAVVVSGSYAYVAADNAGLQIVDISDPNVPRLIGSVSMKEAEDVFVSDPYAFAQYKNGVRVIDISVPSSPREVGVFGSLSASHVAVLGRYAYVTGGRLETFDLCSTVGPFPTIAHSTTSLTNTCNQGTNAPDQSFEVWNSGEGILEYFLSASKPWLSFEPDTGTSWGEHDSITIHYDTAAVSPGTHSATITISQPQALNNPQYIDVTLTADPVTHTVVTNASPPEGGAVSGAGTYDYGETVTVTASPNEGWLFDHWEGTDIGGSENNPEHLTMTSDKTVTAVFVPFMPWLSVQISPYGAGTATGFGTYAYMDTAVVEATPNLGWVFDHWEWAEIHGSTNNPEYVLMDEDKTVMAVFRRTELTGIYLVEPLNESVSDIRPLFKWISDGGNENLYAVEISVPPQLPFWSTYNNLQLVIRDERWRMPIYIYNQIPNGSFVYWRVRAVDIAPQPPVVAYSNEVWWFYKP